MVYTYIYIYCTKHNTYLKGYYQQISVYLHFTHNNTKKYRQLYCSISICENNSEAVTH